MLLPRASYTVTGDTQNRNQLNRGACVRVSLAASVEKQLQHSCLHVFCGNCIREVSAGLTDTLAQAILQLLYLNESSVLSEQRYYCQAVSYDDANVCEVPLREFV